MSIVSTLRINYCPHCGEPYLVKNNQMYDPFWFCQPYRCRKCLKIIKPDILGIGNIVGMVKHTKKTLKKAKKIAEWLAS